MSVKIGVACAVVAAGIAAAVGACSEARGKGDPAAGGSGGAATQEGRDVAAASGSGGAGGGAAAAADPRVAGEGGAVEPVDAGGGAPDEDAGPVDESVPGSECDPNGDYFIAFTLHGEPLRFDKGCGPVPGVPSGEFFRNVEFENDVVLGACMASDTRGPHVVVDDAGTPGDWRDLGAPGYVGDSTGRVEYFNLDLSDLGTEWYQSIRIRYARFEPVGGVIEGTFESGDDLIVTSGEFRVCRVRPRNCSSDPSVYEFCHF